MQHPGTSLCTASTLSGIRSVLSSVKSDLSDRATAIANRIPTRVGIRPEPADETLLALRPSSRPVRPVFCPYRALSNRLPP